MDQCGGTSASDDHDTVEGGLARNRSRREKKDRYGRKAAFEQFREARSGQRPRYAISEERNIYDEVDEEEYSKIVRGRQDDDWIVDDGTGYVEDGREIFDDDLEAVVTTGKRKSTGNTNAKPAKNPNIRPTDSKPKSIRGMFAAAAAKPKVPKAVSLEDDDILGDIMGELKKGDAQTIRPAPVKMIRQVEPGYISSKMNEVKSNGFTAVGAKLLNSEPQYRTALIPSRVDGNDSSFSNKSTGSSAERSQRIKTANNHNEKSSDQLKNGSALPVSQQIQEFASQELFESDHHSQVIEDFDNEMDTSAVCSEVDVSGIDFNDNFEQELSVNKLPGVFVYYISSIPYHWFLARDSMLSALYAVANPSVRLSHGWISRKRLKLGSCNFHRTVAQSL